MSTFLGMPSAPAARCDCRRCPRYTDAEPAIAIAPLCSGCNSDCAYCGCARTDCRACPIRCGSRTDIDAWMRDVGGTLEFDGHQRSCVVLTNFLDRCGGRLTNPGNSIGPSWQKGV